jgi:hypothetical protein
MKVEHFAAFKGEPPRVLIYGDEPDRVVLLRERVASLASGEVDRFAVHELPGFESVDACKLYFSRGEWDRGVRLAAAPRVFDCGLKRASWNHVEGLLEPFCTRIGPGHFQFLADCEASEFEMIISTDRGW